MHETIRKAYLSLLPLPPLCVCVRERDRDRVQCGERERERERERDRQCVRCMCETALQFPRGCHCRIYPFPPSELDLTRLHNICMGAAEFMYMVAEGVCVCVRRVSACVCVWGR